MSRYNAWRRAKYYSRRRYPFSGWKSARKGLSALQGGASPYNARRGAGRFRGAFMGPLNARNRSAFWNRTRARPPRVWRPRSRRIAGGKRSITSQTGYSYKYRGKYTGWNSGARGYSRYAPAYKGPRGYRYGNRGRM